MKSFLLPIIIFLVPVFLKAQTDSTGKKKPVEINADLPDETEETDLVETGKLQIETGVLYNRYKEDGPASVIGQGLLRYGVSKRLEVRLLVEDGRQRDTYITKTVQSTYPMAASAKVLLLQDVKGLPDVTLVSYLKLPFTSHNSLQKAYWSPSIGLAFQNKFGSDKFKLEYNVGGQQEAYSTDWVVFVNASMHYKLTDQLELFTEYFSQLQPGETPQHNLGGGVSYQLNNYFEFYVSSGGTIHYDEANHFYSGGVAMRLP